jgi:hypothetical protein
VRILHNYWSTHICSVQEPEEFRNEVSIANYEGWSNSRKRIVGLIELPSIDPQNPFEAGEDGGRPRCPTRESNPWWWRWTWESGFWGRSAQVSLEIPPSHVPEGEGHQFPAPGCPGECLCQKPSPCSPRCPKSNKIPKIR